MGNPELLAQQTWIPSNEAPKVPDCHAIQATAVQHPCNFICKMVDNAYSKRYCER